MDESRRDDLLQTVIHSNWPERSCQSKESAKENCRVLHWYANFLGYFPRLGANNILRYCDANTIVEYGT